jgi:hypothetical protein
MTDSDLSISAVLNLICLEIDTKNGILLTYMMSHARVTSRYLLITCIGMLVRSLWTCSVVVRVVFPLSDPTLGPKMSSAATMSSFVTGQLRSCCSWMTRVYVRVLGLPIMFCSLRANTARE